MKIAMPKGRLLPGVQEVLAQAGVVFCQPHPRTYTLEGSDPAVQAKLYKPRAIPQLVALGICDVGFVGLDLVKESGYEQVIVLLDLGLNPVEIVVAVHQSTPDLLEHPPKRPLVIATEYVNLSYKWAIDRGLSHIVIQTWGSTEGYAPDEADIVFDCTETGATIDANGLILVGHILRSSTCLIANARSMEDPQTRQHIERLRQALEEVIHA